jgi:hypothetical protein
MNQNKYGFQHQHVEQHLDEEEYIEPTKRFTFKGFMIFTGITIVSTYLGMYMFNNP